jgi:hypothetical protein
MHATIGSSQMLVTVADKHLREGWQQWQQCGLMYNANVVQKLKKRPPHYIRFSILELQGRCSNCSREKQRSH